MKIKNMFIGVLEEVWAELKTYTNNGATAIQLWCEDGPYATLTVNIPGVKLSTDEFIVDLNNCPWAADLLIREWIALPTNRWEVSGFGVYPVYKFTRYGREHLIGTDNNDLGAAFGPALADFIAVHPEYRLELKEGQGYNSPEQVHLSISIDFIDAYKNYISLGVINTYYDTLSQYSSMKLEKSKEDGNIQNLFKAMADSKLLEVMPIVDYL